MKTILFDESCAGWCKNREVSRMFLARQSNYLAELLLSRGYVYLNQVYECLGAKWDPTWENLCWYGRPILIDIIPIEIDSDKFWFKIY